MADADESELSFVLDEFFVVSLRRNVALIKQVIIVVTLVLTKAKIRLKISKITKIAIQQENVNVLYKLCVKSSYRWIAGEEGVEEETQT